MLSASRSRRSHLVASMSIATKTGDAGETALMYGRRVPKMDRRVEAYGTVDELNTALGLARATTKAELLQNTILAVQKELVVLMGELAVADVARDPSQRHAYKPAPPPLPHRLTPLTHTLQTI